MSNYAESRNEGQWVFASRLGIATGRIITEAVPPEVREGCLFATSTFYPAALGRFTGCTFYRCAFVPMNYNGTADVYFENCTFVECNFEYLRWTGVIAECTFISCAMVDCDFSEAVSFDCRFWGSRLKEVIIPKSQEWLRAVLLEAAHLQWDIPEEVGLPSGSGRECKELLMKLDEVWDCDKVPEFIRSNMDVPLMQLVYSRIRGDRITWM